MCVTTTSCLSSCSTSKSSGFLIITIITIITIPAAVLPSSFLIVIFILAAWWLTVETLGGKPTGLTGSTSSLFMSIQELLRCKRYLSNAKRSQNGVLHWGQYSNKHTRQSYNTTSPSRSVCGPTWSTNTSLKMWRIYITKGLLIVRVSTWNIWKWKHKKMTVISEKKILRLSTEVLSMTVKETKKSSRYTPWPSILHKTWRWINSSTVAWKVIWTCSSHLFCRDVQSHNNNRSWFCWRWQPSIIIRSLLQSVVNVRRSN